MSRYRRTSQSDNNSTTGFGGGGSGGERGDGSGVNGEGGVGGGGDLPEWYTDDSGFEGGFDAAGQFMSAPDDPFPGIWAYSFGSGVQSIPW